MQKILSLLLTLSVLLIVQSNQEAKAQGAYHSQARTGAYGRTAQRTRNYNQASHRRTQRQRIPIRRTTRSRLAYINGPTGHNGLPPTRLDSFVRAADDRADLIYGGEGVTLPRHNEFDKEHRINYGITGARDQGLTTGHGSIMPDAWGGDEYVDGPEYSLSGANGGNGRHFSQGQYLGADPVAGRANAPVNRTQVSVAPGGGYMPAIHNGQFLGYYSPAEVAMLGSDPQSATRSFVRSSRFMGNPQQAQSLITAAGR